MNLIYQLPLNLLQYLFRVEHKAVSGSDVILTWDAVTASDLAEYKIYTRSGEVYTLLDIVNKDLTSFTVSGGDISTNCAITSYDNSADGSNDQLDGSESWYSDDFSKLVFTLSVASNDAITTVGPASLCDKWLLKNNNGDSAVFNESLSRANDWNYSSNSSNAREDTLEESGMEVGMFQV